VKAYESRARIDASPQEVWAVLVDGAAWPEWDSGVLRVDGDIAPGATVTVVSSASPGRGFGVRITGFEPARSMTWTGGMPLGLFRGVRTYTLEPASGGTAFRMREEYTGPLAGLIGRSIPDLQPLFDQFARGLKTRAEHGAGAP
jgi:hypothetical protein